jgi:enoyl-CoA hydratase/carnithine racemase
LSSEIGVGAAGNLLKYLIWWFDDLSACNQGLGHGPIDPAGGVVKQCCNCETEEMSEFQNIVVTRDGAIATLTLNRPDKRNSLSLETMLEITRALQAIGISDADGVIIAANGPVFSAGHNFADMAGADSDETRHIFEICTDMMDTLQAIPQPVIAKVHALATAAGCQLVATCDLAIAAESASFAIPGGKGGLFCHTPLVTVARNLSRKRALEMAMTGDAIDASTAADWGLINRAVPDDQLDAAVLDLITRATRGSILSKAIGKQTFYDQINMAQDQAYDFAIDIMADAAASPDAQEGIDAFLNKRSAVFTQRPN